jgi:hypothetical protein
MTQADDDADARPADHARREQIRALLAAGLVTEVFPRADTSEDFAALAAQVRQAREASGDLTAILVKGGFTLHTVEHGGIEQPCETCMYYLVHRRYCDLPELDVPVEPEWSCRLWRI